MKNLISIFTFATILFFTACTKETMLLPENASPDTIESFNSTKKSTNTTAESNVEFTSFSSQLEVSVISYTVAGNELLVDFSGSYDFSEVTLEDTQHLVLVDANGNQSTLSFEVSHFTGSNELLQTTFAVGGNNLFGLELTEVQSIIIEDVIME